MDAPDLLGLLSGRGLKPLLVIYHRGTEGTEKTI